MEGTRHEKAFLVITAYVIGFTTAFIAFAIPNMQSYDAVDALTFAPTVKSVSVSTPTLSVGKGEEGLYAITPTYQRLLSVDRSTLGANLIDSAPSSGYYYAIIDAEASRNGQFVYYCEQIDESDTTCDPYVYELATDSLHPVTVDGAQVKPVIADHTAAWTDTSELMIDDHISADPAQPWVLVPLKLEVQ
jgi:hypothetical protein